MSGTGPQYPEILDRLGVFNPRPRHPIETIFVPIDASGLIAAIRQVLTAQFGLMACSRRYEAYAVQLVETQSAILSLALLEKVKAANRNQNLTWYAKLPNDLKALEFHKDYPVPEIFSMMIQRIGVVQGSAASLHSGTFFVPIIQNLAADFINVHHLTAIRVANLVQFLKDVKAKVAAAPVFDTPEGTLFWLHRRSVHEKQVTVVSPFEGTSQPHFERMLASFFDISAYFNTAHEITEADWNAHIAQAQAPRQQLNALIRKLSHHTLVDRAPEYAIQQFFSAAMFEADDYE